MNRIFLLSSVLILGGCAYAVESNNQEIQFVAQGAENTKCHVFVDKLRYQVYPPQTVNIKKSPKDMVVRCQAAGNRAVEMEVPAQFASRSLWGTPAGVAWDYASESLFRYPSVIAVDFSQELVRYNAAPTLNAQVEEHDLEEVAASEARLNKDRGRASQPLRKRSRHTKIEDILDDLDPKAGEELFLEPLPLVPEE